MRLSIIYGAIFLVGCDDSGVDLENNKADYGEIRSRIENCWNADFRYKDKRKFDIAYDAYFALYSDMMASSKKCEKTFIHLEDPENLITEYTNKFPKEIKYKMEYGVIIALEATGIIMHQDYYPQVKYKLQKVRSLKIIDYNTQEYREKYIDKYK